MVLNSHRFDGEGGKEIDFRNFTNLPANTYFEGWRGQVREMDNWCELQKVHPVHSEDQEDIMVLFGSEPF